MRVESQATASSLSHLVSLSVRSGFVADCRKFEIFISGY
jgi:hypothetical protein